MEPVWHQYFGGVAVGPLHSVYVHPSLGFRSYPDKSIFRGRAVPQHLRSATTWGGAGLVRGARHLLRVALRDPINNSYFVLLSESCVPLYSLVDTHAYLHNERASLVSAPPPVIGTTDTPMVEEVYKSNIMHLYNISRTNLIVSSQWWTLRRDHARYIAYEQTYWSRFNKMCEITGNRPLGQVSSLLCGRVPSPSRGVVHSSRLSWSRPPPAAPPAHLPRPRTEFAAERRRST